MFMLQENLNKEVAVRPMPDLPAAGQVIARQAIGHLDSRTGLVLLDRVVSRSAYGAEKFGEAWRERDNCKELCEETSDAVVYGAQETARVELGLTPLAPHSEPAAIAQDYLEHAVRYAALADHFSQMAAAVINDTEPGDPR